MSAHEAIFNAINGVHRDPFLSLSAANAVVEMLDRIGMAIVPAGTNSRPGCCCGGCVL